jgi:hypothetical protein
MPYIDHLPSSINALEVHWPPAPPDLMLPVVHYSRILTFLMPKSFHTPKFISNSILPATQLHTLTSQTIGLCDRTCTGSFTVPAKDCRKPGFRYSSTPEVENSWSRDPRECRSFN